MRKILLYCFLLLTIFSSCQQQPYSKEALVDCTKHLSQTEKIYFSKVGFHNYSKIQRWNHDINVSLGGDNVKAEDVSLVRNIIKQLSPLIAPLKIRLIETGEGDIAINITSNHHPEFKYGESIPRMKLFSNGSFVKATVNIYKPSDSRMRSHIMHHELMHAIGFNHPLYKNEPYIFHDSHMQPINLQSYDEAEEIEYHRTHNKYTALDEKMIKLLYCDCLFSGYELTYFKKFLKL